MTLISDGDHIDLFGETAPGEYPEFSDEQKALIRGLIAAEHRRLHSEKNVASDRETRDQYTREMVRLEDLNQMVAKL